MPLVDSHCHLQDAKFADDREAVIERALREVDWLVVIGDDLPTSRAAAALVRDRIHATVGIHPYYAAQASDNGLAELRELAQYTQVVGLGEIGLDYYKYNDTPRDVQQTAFARQLELAAELELPVVIHNREADDDVATILDEYAGNVPGGVMHCFGSPPAYVDRCLKWDFYISFAGNVTFPKAEPLREAARRVPLDRILIETDAPYLAPQPVRGKRCEPQYVAHTADSLADYLNVPRDEFRAQTAANAKRLFRVAP